MKDPDHVTEPLGLILLKIKDEAQDRCNMQQWHQYNKVRKLS
jgi:hypothetical protein